MILKRYNFCLQKDWFNEKKAATRVMAKLKSCQNFRDFLVEEKFFDKVQKMHE